MKGFTTSRKIGSEEVFWKNILNLYKRSQGIPQWPLLNSQNKLFEIYCGIQIQDTYDSIPDQSSKPTNKPVNDRTRQADGLSPLSVAKKV